MCCDRTFAELSAESELLDKCRELCECLADDMSSQGVTVSRCVIV